MSCSLVNGVLFFTASMYSGEANFSVYEFIKNKGSYSYSLGFPKYNRDPASDVMFEFFSSKKILSGLISPLNKSFL